MSGKRDRKGRASHEITSLIHVAPNKSARLTNDVTMATNTLAVAAEAVAFTAGAAGTTGIVALDKAPVMDAIGAGVGAFDDTSFEWVTGTVLTTEVAYNEEALDAAFLAGLANGEWAMDYVLGKIFYCKDTAGVGDTCNYSTRQLNVELTAGGDIEIGSVELKDGTSDARAIINAANTARVATNEVVLVQNIDAAGDVPDWSDLDDINTAVQAVYDSATSSNKSYEINPISEHHVEETLLDLTNIAQTTTAYGYFDMDGYRNFALQGETSGAGPTDVLTVTVEATIQDDGTAAASCTYQDVTNSLFGVASWVDVDFMAICDTPAPFKYVRVKYTTSTGGGNDADLTVFLKKLY